MPRTNAQTKRKTPAPAPTPPRATSRRRAPHAPHETPPPSISGPEGYQGPPTILPAPELPEPAPEQEVAPRVPSPPTALSPALTAELTALWPDLQALASWWQQRQHLAQQDDTPDRKLARQTYHVEQRYIDAVKREADRTGESYAAVVNRAFARYFTGR
jgi:hypothetical protein